MSETSTKIRFIREQISKTRTRFKCGDFSLSNVSEMKSIYELVSSKRSRYESLFKLWSKNDIHGLCFSGHFKRILELPDDYNHLLIYGLNVDNIKLILDFIITQSTLYIISLNVNFNTTKLPSIHIPECILSDISQKTIISDTYNEKIHHMINTYENINVLLDDIKSLTNEYLPLSASKIPKTRESFRVQKAASISITEMLSYHPIFQTIHNLNQDFNIESYCDSMMINLNDSLVSLISRISQYEIYKSDFIIYIISYDTYSKTLSLTINTSIGQIPNITIKRTNISILQAHKDNIKLKHSIDVSSEQETYRNIQHLKSNDQACIHVTTTRIPMINYNMITLKCNYDMFSAGKSLITFHSELKNEQYNFVPETRSCFPIVSSSDDDKERLMKCFINTDIRISTSSDDRFYLYVHGILMETQTQIFHDHARLVCEFQSDNDNKEFIVSLFLIIAKISQL